MADRVSFSRGADAPDASILDPGRLYVQTGDAGVGDTYLDYSDSSGQATRIRLTDSRKLDTAEAESDYLKKNDAAEIYETQDHAASTYLPRSGGRVDEIQIGSATQYLAITGTGVSYSGNTDLRPIWRNWLGVSTTAELDTMYLRKTEAASTYLSLSAAQDTYLTKAAAATLYQPIESAGNPYITQTSGDARYQLQSSMSAYATQSWVNNQGFATQTWVNSQGFATTAALSNYVLQSNLDSAVASAGYITKTTADSLYVKLDGGGRVSDTNGILAVDGTTVAFLNTSSVQQWKITDDGPSFDTLEPAEAWIRELSPVLIAYSVSSSVDPGYTADVQITADFGHTNWYTSELVEGQQLQILVPTSFTAASILFCVIYQHGSTAYEYYGQKASGGYTPSSLTYPMNSVFTLVVHNDSLYPVTLPFPDVGQLAVTTIDDGHLTTTT